MKTYDLNLLPVLDAVLACGSVTAAAERLHLSVPATSHALARLREAVGDPLLVRAGRRLVPTPRAQALREPVSQWVAAAAALLAAPVAGGIAAVERHFVVRAPDGIAIAFGPALAEALQRDMPLARLSFVPEIHDDAGALRDGRVDIDMGSFEPRDPELQVVRLGGNRLVAVVRHGHPLALHNLTARRYVAHPQITVQQRGRSESPVDRALEALGLRRRVVMTVAQANIAALIASRSDLVATLADRMAQAMAPLLGLQILRLGFAPEPDPFVVAWHPRYAADSPHAWLRGRLLAILRGE